MTYATFPLVFTAQPQVEYDLSVPPATGEGLAEVLTNSNDAGGQLAQHFSALAIDSLNGASEAIICVVESDPSAGAGVPSPVGTLALAADGTLWEKTSAPDTGWDIVYPVPRTVRFAAGVPAGAPVYPELPIAFDSTGGTGGVYYWDGAAWQKGGTI